MSVTTVSPLARTPRVVQAEVDLSGPLSPALVGALTESCARAEDTEDGAFLVLRLTGGQAAPTAWPGNVGVHLVSKWEKALRRLERLALCTIGVAEGRYTQAALEVLLATDVRVATPDSVLASNGTLDGGWPGMVLHRLVQQVGLASARRLTVLPRDLDAATLRNVGVLDEVVTDVDATVASLVARAGGTEGTETAVRRLLLMDAVTVGYEEALGAHLAACDRTLRRAAAGDGE